MREEWAIRFSYAPCWSGPQVDRPLLDPRDTRGTGFEVTLYFERRDWRFESFDFWSALASAGWEAVQTRTKVA